MANLFDLLSDDDKQKLLQARDDASREEYQANPSTDVYNQLFGDNVQMQDQLAPTLANKSAEDSADILKDAPTLSSAENAPSNTGLSASSNIQDLTGNGTEYLLDKDGNPIGKFVNGKLDTTSDFAGSSADTIPIGEASATGAAADTATEAAGEGAGDFLAGMGADVASGLGALSRAVGVPATALFEFLKSDNKTPDDALEAAQQRAAMGNQTPANNNPTPTDIPLAATSSSAASRGPASSDDSDEEEDDQTQQPKKQINPLDTLFSKVFGDDAVKQALAQQQQTRQDAAINLGMHEIAAGLSRGAAPANTQLYNAMMEHSGDALKGLQARQQAALGQLEAGMKLTDLQDKQLLRDPSSPVSQAYRDMALQLNPKLGNSPNFQNLDAEGVKQLEPMVDMSLRMQMLQNQRMMMQQYRQGQIEDRAKADMATKISSLQNRGAIKNALDADRRVDNLTSLMGQYGTDFNAMPQAQVNLFAKELEQIASGGVAREGSTKELMPATLMSSLSSLLSRGSNNVTGAQLGTFLSQYQPYLQDLQNNARAFMGTQIKPIITGYNRIMRPEDLNEMMSDAGYGKYLQAAQAGGGKSIGLPTAAGAPLNKAPTTTPSQDAEALQWARQNLGSQDLTAKMMAMKILKANGVM